MEKRRLGRTGIEVSRMCFGTLTFRQLNIEPKKASEIIIHAIDKGVNFVDTAQGYATYEHVRLALKARPGFVVNTKSPAKTYDEMKESIESARRQMGLDTIDSFLLHGCGGPGDGLQERRGALDCLLEAKSRGIVKAVGVSCHYIAGVEEAAACEDIDVCHPLVNMLGKGLPDGTAADMEEACARAHKAGKGIYGMKSLAGGLLIPKRYEAFEYVLSREFLDAVAVGMTTANEVDYNIAMFEGKHEGGSASVDLKPEGMKLFILKSCVGCGDCVKVCPSGAMSIVDGKAQADPELCLTCGYCGFACKNFCIRLV